MRRCTGVLVGSDAAIVSGRRCFASSAGDRISVVTDAGSSFVTEAAGAAEDLGVTSAGVVVVFASMGLTTIRLVTDGQATSLVERTERLLQWEVIGNALEVLWIYELGVLWSVLDLVTHKASLKEIPLPETPLKGVITPDCAFLSSATTHWRITWGSAALSRIGRTPHTTEATYGMLENGLFVVRSRGRVWRLDASGNVVKTLKFSSSAAWNPNQCSLIDDHLILMNTSEGVLLLDTRSVTSQKLLPAMACVLRRGLVICACQDWLSLRQTLDALLLKTDLTAYGSIGRRTLVSLNFSLEAKPPSVEFIQAAKTWRESTESVVVGSCVIPECGWYMLRRELPLCLDWKPLGIHGPLWPSLERQQRRHAGRQRPVKLERTTAETTQRSSPAASPLQPLHSTEKRAECSRVVWPALHTRKVLCSSESFVLQSLPLETATRITQKMW
ncbi:MAG: uncharacterized protein KVP18_003354 [Porospora cf. gigantea A]|uniref:uncharacterized protein n=1 Tax=Porospora cf. gigantea A TaxID=2853593 RepID=UPI0035597F5B|nr:MAG: hypothetical protein KVP18_003354 [Porospora cf. gigantea A]